MAGTIILTLIIAFTWILTPYINGSNAIRKNTEAKEMVNRLYLEANIEMKYCNYGKAVHQQ